jgi:Leucine-rich repeat (LRR) protein
LHLRNNGLKSLPANLFKECSQLTTLDLHGTEITNDVLRQVSFP